MGDISKMAEWEAPSSHPLTETPKTQAELPEPNLSETLENSQRFAATK